MIQVLSKNAVSISVYIYSKPLRSYLSAFFADVLNGKMEFRYIHSKHTN